MLLACVPMALFAIAWIGYITYYIYTSGWIAPGASTWMFIPRNLLTSLGMQLILLAILWPWLTYLTLQVFRISRRRLNIRPAHVLRCVAYSCDGAAWLAILFAPVEIADAWQFDLHRPLGEFAAHVTDMIIPHWRRSFDSRGLMLLLLLLFVPLMSWRLYVALRSYLRFDPPAAVVLCGQAIVLMFAWVALLWFT